jgi:urease accessory protein
MSQNSPLSKEADRRADGPESGASLLPAQSAPTAKAPRMQRARGAARLQVQTSDGSTRIRRLYQRGSSRIRMTASQVGQSADAVLINTAGGLAGGDRFDWAVEAEAGANCTVITQACEKVYRSTGPFAEVNVRLTVGREARLDWLPQETILFNGARLKRTFHVELGPGAKLLAMEAVVLGRRAMGERLYFATLQDQWRIWRCGRLVFADNLTLEGCVDARTSRTAVLGGAGAFTSLLYAANDAEAHLGAVRDAVGSSGGASAFGGKLFCRAIAADGIALRRVLFRVLAALRQAPLPRLWTI